MATRRAKRTSRELCTCMKKVLLSCRSFHSPTAFVVRTHHAPLCSILVARVKNLVRASHIPYLILPAVKGQARLIRPIVRLLLTRRQRIRQTKEAPSPTTLSTVILDRTHGLRGLVLFLTENTDAELCRLMLQTPPSSPSYRPQKISKPSRWEMSSCVRISMRSQAREQHQASTQRAAKSPATLVHAPKT